MHNFRRTLLATSIAALVPVFTAPQALAQQSTMGLEEVVG
jgi:hypothetical protein